MKTKSRGFTLIELAIVGMIPLAIAILAGICVGGAYIVVAAANLLFNAGWAYDFAHIAIIAACIFLAMLIFGGGASKARS